MVKQWENIHIGDVLTFKNGLNKSKEYFGFGTPIVNYTDVYKKRGLRTSDVQGRVSLSKDEIRRFQVQKNDVFFTRTSETPDEVGISSVLLEEIDDCVFSGFVLRGRPKDDSLIPEYCKYCFSTEAVRSAIISGCTYTTRALTNGTQLSAIEIPLPSLEEQQKIAEALSDMDELIASLEKMIAKKKVIKQGAMQELLTGKKRLPGFEGEWNIYKISDVCETASGGTPSRANTEYYSGDIPWFTTSELSDGWLYDSSEHITEMAINNSSAKLFEPHTVLIAMYGATIGKLGILSRFACTNQACCALFAKDIDYLFLFYYLLRLRKSLIKMGCGAGQPNISQEIIRAVSINIPAERNEQQAIASILSDMDAEIEALEQKLDKCRQTKQGMMQQLLTGKIRLV